MSKKIVDFKKYVKDVECIAGNYDAIQKYFEEDDEDLKKYLIHIGMNAKWVELPAVMEVVKGKIEVALKENDSNFKIRQNGIILGKNDENIIKSGLFELGNLERFEFCVQTGFINYINENYFGGFIKKEISPETGIVVHEIRTVGNNTYEFFRDENRPIIMFYINNKFKEKRIDCGYPIGLENCDFFIDKTPSYYIKRYPKYAVWFNKKMETNKDELVKNLYEMQKNKVNKIIENEGKRLGQKVIVFARYEEKLCNYYKKIKNEFELRENNYYNYNIDEVVRVEGKNAAKRIASNDVFKKIRGLFDIKIRIFVSKYYTVDEILQEIDEKNKFVKEIFKNRNPFNNELNTIDDEISSIKDKMMFLEKI